MRLRMSQEQQAQDDLIRSLAEVSPLELPTVASQVGIPNMLKPHIFSCVLCAQWDATQSCFCMRLGQV